MKPLEDTLQKRTSIEESVEVEVPVRDAYEAWLRLDEFEHFLGEHVSLERLDGEHVRCKHRMAGRDREFVAEICEHVPGKRIAWRTTSGTRHAGVVTFHRLDDERSKVMLQYDLESAGLREALTDLLGSSRRWTRGALEDFKNHVERRTDGRARSA